MMHRTRTIRVLASISAIIVCALTQLTVAAAPPRVEQTRNVVIDVTSGVVNATCGFPVHLHTEGFYTTISFVDDEGNLTREIRQAVFHGSLSANGQSIPSMVAGPEQVTVNDDGTLTLTIIGVTHRHVPGTGHIGSSAGRGVVLLTFDDQGNVIGEELVQQTGLAESLTEVCAFLAPDE